MGVPHISILKCGEAMSLFACQINKTRRDF
jgi:hypothetical protein